MSWRRVSNEEVRAELFHPVSPAHAHVLLQTEQLEEFNYFLEEMDHF